MRGTFGLSDFRPGQQEVIRSIVDGRDTVGTVNGVPTGSAAVNDTFAAVVLSQGGSVAENYNFGERPATNGGVAAGQTATIGFWQNNKGQSLISALNGGASATQLGHWLAVTFPNLYASLDGMTNAGVAAAGSTCGGGVGTTAGVGGRAVTGGAVVRAVTGIAMG